MGKQRFICIELTESCNNACRHCYNIWREKTLPVRSSRKRVLTRQELIGLVKKIQRDIPLQYVALSGGEPLLRSDAALIAGDLLDLGLDPIVLTNGVLLSESQLRRMPQGITYQVSLLGHTAALHDAMTGRTTFERVIRNMARIERYGSHMSVVFVASKLNALAVDRTVELALAVGAQAIMYNRVNVSSAMKGFAGDVVPPLEMLCESLERLQAVVKRYDMPAVCSVPIPPCIVDPARYPDIQFGWCPRGGKNAYYTIGCDGTVRPCNHSSVILGDLLKRGFSAITASPQSRAYWKVWPSECLKCDHPLRKLCHGGCTAASHEFYGSQRRLDPYCELALIK